MHKSIGPQTILHPHPVLLIGSYDAEGAANMATASWTGICCSKPPCMAVSLRQATKTSHNIMQARAFTAAIPTVDQVRIADFCGVVSGRDVDKFAETGLTLVRSELVNAPYAAEMRVVLECDVVHTFDLGLHTQFVGQIRDLKADPVVLGDNGLPDIAKLRPLVYATGNKAYFAIGEMLYPGFTTRSL